MTKLMTDRDGNEVLAAWETSSKYWNKHQAAIEKMFAPLTRALVTAANIQPGKSLLDIGGGSGEPSLTLSTIVGSSGRVTYTDPAAGMVKAALDEAERRGLSNITFHQSPAERLPFPDNTFDAVVGRLSAMFFVDPESALREVLRVTKTGGRIAFLVWAAREVNPFFSVISDVLNQFVPAEPEDEDAPSAFRFARPGKLAKLFRDAGAIEVTEETVLFRIAHSIDIEGFWELRTETSDTFRGKLAQLDSEQVPAVKAAAAKAVAEFFENGKMNFPAQVLTVTGRKK
jgi:ubiquinone/menaquinone biosynthesis C-methylase UbiE